ncbi:hypothetical protein B7463_g12087, partial [Scytalidium lignicola]
MSSGLRQRAVVSSFICTSPQSPAGLTFALFKRSQDVSTYRGKWAVCSGSIDPNDNSPEHAAQREILEETALSVPEDIQLLRRGKKFSLIDQQLKTEWTIYPFAWELKPGAKPITFDWEHTEYKFIKPDEMEQYEHVPQLEVGMRRVLVSDETEKGLQALREDHESGAQALAVKALQILLNSVQQGDLSKLDNTEDFWNQFRWMAWHLGKNGRPSMAAAIEAQLFKSAESIKAKLDSSTESTLEVIPVDKARKIAKEAIELRIEAAQTTLENLAGNFVSLVESRPPVDRVEDQSRPIHIVTLSFSGTITQCLSCLICVLATRGFNISLSVLESRPKFEGTSFVNGLLSRLRYDPSVINKLQVEVVSDASVATVTRNADYLVLGGDKVLPNGDVSNKIGSLVAAIVTKSINPECQVVAAFETSKITSSSFEGNNAKVEYNEPTELSSAWPKDVVDELSKKRHIGFKLDVKNAYFEWVTAKWIDAYITEQGVFKVEDIERLSKESKELEVRMFGDLQASRYEPTPFGKAMLKHFAFAKGYRNLNHGSYGTWPTAIRDIITSLRDQCEATPCPFIKWEYPKILDDNRMAIAKFLKVPVSSVVFVPNATTAVNTVLRNITWNLDARDEILQFNIIYGACGKTTEYIRESTHNLVTVREIPLKFPLEDFDILEAFRGAINASRISDHRPRLAIFDTIVSNPGLRLPFEYLTSICHEEGILSLIDGAHGIGHINFELSTLDPDFFVSNCHKWLFVPRGCAVFYVPERNQTVMRSTLPTSHGFSPEPDSSIAGRKNSSQHWSVKKAVPKGSFVSNFEYVGTVDYTPYLCVAEAIKWREEVCGGEEKIRDYCHNLAVQGGKRVAEILGTRILDNETHTLTNCNMVNILLPISLGKGEVEGKNIVIDGEGMQEAVTTWMLETIVPDYRTYIPFFWFQNGWWCRLSAQVYMDMEDFEWAGRALKDLCERVGRGEFLAEK